MASSPELFRSALWASVPSQMIPFLREMFENLDPGGWHQMKTQRVLYKPATRENDRFGCVSVFNDLHLKLPDNWKVEILGRPLVPHQNQCIIQRVSISPMSDNYDKLLQFMGHHFVKSQIYEGWKYMISEEINVLLFQVREMKNVNSSVSNQNEVGYICQVYIDSYNAREAQKKVLEFTEKISSLDFIKLDEAFIRRV